MLSKIWSFLFKDVYLHPEKKLKMKKRFAITLMSALFLGLVAPLCAQNTKNADAIEHELAVTAYNYAAGCAQQGNYEEALEGLTHIPANRLTAEQQGWADTLRMKCEALAGHPMANVEIELTESEKMMLDDQSDLFLSGIRNYEKADYAKARDLMTEVIELGDGPREQVYIEALFWRGQCNYQLQNWEKCCDDLILFNDTKNSNTDSYCDAMAYYTMGYARMQLKKWRQARLNFERYIEREMHKDQACYTDGVNRYAECKQLEVKKGNAPIQLPLAAIEAKPLSGESLILSNMLSQVYSQAGKEKQKQTDIARQLRYWQAPFIE